MLSYRKAGREDYDIFYDILSKGEADEKVEGNCESNIKEYEEILDCFDLVFIFLSESEKAIGYAQLIDCDKTTFIWDIYIQPENRKQGFGRKFVEYIEEMTREKGINEVVLLPFDAEGDVFCEKVGYKMSGDYNLHVKILTSNSN